LINISHVGNQKAYADYDITWDNGNRITDFDFTYLNGPAKKNQSNYRYDKTSQLINASYSFMPNERYYFDKNGNRIKAEIQNKEQTYKTVEYNRLISDNESEYKYDLEGNRIAKISKDGSTIKYHWDNRNRLVKIETPNGIIEYIYDHQNRLVQRKQGETTTTFIHDGWQIILQFDNDKLTHRYLWGTKQDELICDNDNWTLGDHLNTIRDIVKSDGTVTDHLEYNSFGKIISATKNDSSLQFAYTGKLTDKVSELQWNINRWYDAKVGRWVSEDPIGFKGGDGNLYRYVVSNVNALLDVNGLTGLAITDPQMILAFDINRDVNKSRAIVEIKRSGYTVSHLATLLELNHSEYTKWLKPVDGKPLPVSAYEKLNKCRKFSVPNKVVYYKAKRGLLDFAMVISSLQIVAENNLTNFTSDKYQTKTITSGLKNDFVTNFQDDDVVAFLFVGHGDSGYLGLIYDGDAGDTVGPFDVKRPFGLQYLFLAACYSANETIDTGDSSRKGYWSMYVSQLGTFTGGDKEVYGWSSLKSWIGTTPP
jgi:RHS repeat-associated protein